MKKNLLLITISNALLSVILIILGAYLIFRFDLSCENFISNIIMLAVGLNCGTLSKNFPNKKLIFAVICSALLFFIYLVVSFALPYDTLDLYAYIPMAINLLIGTIIGCILTISHTKGRFKNETRKNFKH